MTRRRARRPAGCGPPRNGGCRTVWVRSLLGRPVVGAGERHLGHVGDVAVRRTPDPRGAVLTGLVTDVGGVRMFAPAAAVRRWQDRQVLVDAARLRNLSGQDVADGVLLGPIIGRPVTTREGDVAQVADVGLQRGPEGWFVGAVDTRGRVERFLGLPRRPVPWGELVGRPQAPGGSGGSPTITLGARRQVR